MPLNAGVNKINWNSSAYKAIARLMDELDIIYIANHNIRHHVTCPAVFEWQGYNSLDDPICKEQSQK